MGTLAVLLFGALAVSATKATVDSIVVLKEDNIKEWMVQGVLFPSGYFGFGQIREKKYTLKLYDPKVKPNRCLHPKDRKVTKTVILKEIEAVKVSGSRQH